MKMIARIAAIATFGAAVALSGAAAVAKEAKRVMKIQEVTSPGGIKAWLVEERSVPLVAMRFVFKGGSAQDAAGKEGTANFLSAMLDEGAGDLDSAAFQERMEELAVRMSFSASRDAFYGSFQSLTENRDEAIKLLRLAITEPRFEGIAIERIRKQLLTSLAFAAKNPNQVAGKTWSKVAFPNHPYGRSSSGTKESVAAITADDLRDLRQRVFAKSTLKVAVVGDIDAKSLAKLLDDVFGGLADKASLTEIAAAEPAKSALEIVEMPVPQSVAVFGVKGLLRKDPDFVPAYVMNHILGGGGFASRLMEEVREKRGLAYSVYSYLQPMDRAALFAGRVATNNDNIAKSLEVIRGELDRMARTGPSEEDLENAKSYLTGSYALRFDTNSKIASQLLGIQEEDLGIDYVDRRNDLINAVTLDDIRRVAQKILKSGDLVIAVVGQPKNLTAQN